MLYASKNSKVVHFATCHHIKRIQVRHARGFETCAAAKAQGYRLCKCCDPVARTYRREKEELITFSAQNGLISLIKEGEVLFRTVHSQWRVTPSDDGRMMLYHKNTRRRKTDAASPIVGHHLQKFDCHGLLQICDYILQHDAFRYENPLKKNKGDGVKTGSPKGSRKWRAQQKALKKQKRRESIQRVYFLIDQLEAARA